MKVKLNEFLTSITFPDNKEKLEKGVAFIELPSYSEEVFLFVVETYYDHFTGGRLHIFQYAIALCQLGYKVVWLTNCRPIYIDSFKDHDLKNLTILIRGYPSPSVFSSGYVFKNVVGTPLGCIDQVEYYKRSYVGVKYYQIVLVCPLLARQYRSGVDVDDSGIGFQRNIQSMKNADCIWTQTQLNKKWISKWLDYPEEQIKVLPPAVNDNVAKKYLNRRVKNQIIFISRFVSYKHPEMILQIAKDLDYKGKVIMIGGAGGLAYSTLRQMAQKNGINLKIIESCDDDTKFKLMSESKLMLFPSDWEDFGMPPMEAGYYGVPSIAVENPTYDEVFGKYLITSKRDDYEDYLKKVKNVLNIGIRNYDLQYYIMHNYLFENLVVRMKQEFLSTVESKFSLWKPIKTDKQVKILFDTVTNTTARGIGDILMTTPIIRALKKKFLKCKIDYYVRECTKEILINNPYIDNIITDESVLEKEYSFRLRLETKLEDYSIIRNRLHRLDSLIRLFNIPVEDKSLILKLTNREINIAKTFLIDNDKKHIGIAIKTCSPYRNWPIDRFYNLARMLQDNYNVYILDGAKDIYFDDLKLVKNLTNCFTIREISAFVKNLDLLVTLDSGLLHIAGALDIKTIALFGMIPSKLRTSYYKNCQVIEHEHPCPEPCYDMQVGWFKEKCRKEGLCRAMKHITIEEVYAKIRETL